MLCVWHLTSIANAGKVLNPVRFKSVGEATIEGGNIEAVLTKHYLNLATYTEGADFWAIMPAEIAANKKKAGRTVANAIFHVTLTSQISHQHDAALAVAEAPFIMAHVPDLLNDALSFSYYYSSV